MGTDVHSTNQANPTGAPSLLDELMTSQQVADVLRLRVSTVEDYARRGVLPSLKLGRHRRFLRSEVEDAIARLSSSWPN